MTAYQPAHVLLGPFWARVARCSDSDVEQLNYFDAAQKHGLQPGQVPPVYNYGLAIIIGTSELYSFAGDRALSYSNQVVQASRLFTSGAELVVSYARDNGFPRYTPNPTTYKKFATPNVPLLLLVGTLDPQTENGLGAWFVDGLGANATLTTVPYAAHGTVGPSDPCVLQIATDYLLAFGTRPANTSCLASESAPDFEGSLSSTQEFSLASFGTSDLWNGM